MNKLKTHKSIAAGGYARSERGKARAGNQAKGGARDKKKWVNDASQERNAGGCVGVASLFVSCVPLAGVGSESASVAASNAAQEW